MPSDLLRDPSRSHPVRRSAASVAARSKGVLLGLALLVALPACATRTVEDKIHAEKGIFITLRGQQKGGKPVDRGFDQPAIIAPERLAHVLEAIEVRDARAGEGQQQQMGAIATEFIEPLSVALAKALEQADSSQEIAVQAVRKQSHLKLFNEKYLTSFVTYAQGGSLYFHFSRIEWEIPKKRGDRDRGDLPKPRIGEHPMEFSTLSTRGVHKVGSQSAAVAWRDPMFAEALPIRGSGRQRTRTILLDSPVPAEELPSETIERLSPEALRALADLEEARAKGRITEAEYVRQRDALFGPSR